MTRIINLIALLAVTAWLSRSPDWEPFLAFLGLLAGMLTQEYSLLAQHRQRDAELFKKFKTEFPTNGTSARFLKEHDLGGPFPSNSNEELDRFLNTWDNKEHEFINRKLECARKVLLITGNKFRNELSRETGMDHRGWFSMGMHDMEMRPEKIATRNRLNRLANSVYRAHQQLMSTGKFVE